MEDAVLRLRRQRKVAFLQPRHRFRHQPGADIGETVVQRPGRHRPVDGDMGGERHRAGIEALVHLHHHHAGLGVAGHDRPLDRGRAAPARQERGMPVIAAEPRSGQDRLGQEQPIGDDHGDIGAERAKRRDIVGILEIGRCADLKAERLGGALDGGGRELQTPPAGRPWRLGIDGDDVVTGVVQCPQHRYREIGRAHENDPEAHDVPVPLAFRRLQTGLRASNQAPRSLLCSASPALPHIAGRWRRS